MEKFQEFVAIAPWTMIFTWVNLIILVLIMKKLLFKPVLNMLAARDKEVNEMYSKAETAQSSAEALEKEYSEKLSLAKEEAAKIMKDAKHDATLRGEEIVGEAKKEASAILEKAQKEIEREKEAAINEIKGDIANIAVDIAQKVIEKDLHEKDHERLVEEFIDGWGEDK
ncbi:MAG: F0F1 ATP synthase subunit B [Clostridia bacterium]|nr:F0F1 ATP synthase subunit B [Clostridia bacterium]